MDYQQRADFMDHLAPFLGRVSAFKKNYDAELTRNNSKRLSILNLMPTMTLSYSRMPFKNLNRVSLLNLTDGRQENGSYVILQVLVLPVFDDWGFRTVVEDHDGNVVVLNAMFFAETGAITRGSVLILKEPRLTMELDLSVYSVVCCSPTDMMLIDLASDLRPMLRDITWKTVLKELETGPDSAIGWKEQGNNFFRQKSFAKALESYLVSLKIATDEEDEKLMQLLNLNISATYLELGYFESTLSFAKKVFNNAKGFYRAGRAYYELREFEKSAGHFKEVLRIEPANQLGLEWFEKSVMRLKEQEGMVDVTERIRSLSIANPRTCLDCADFIGAVEVTSTPNNGHAVVATEDILPGTILVVSKALLAQFEGTLVTDDATLIFKNKARPVNQSIKQVAQIMKANPSTLAHQVNDLCKSTFDKKSIQKYCEGSEEELAIDMGVLMKFLEKKHNGIFALDGTSIGLGLFVFPGYFNYSCVPNTVWKTFNDVMVIQSVTYIKRGQEILLNKPGNHWMGQSALVRQGVVCSCVLCALDGKESSDILIERADLNRKFEAMHKAKDYSGVETLIKEIKETYHESGRTQYQVDILHPYVVSSMEFFEKKNLAKTLVAADKALAVLGLDRQTLQKCIECKPDYPIFSDHVLVSCWLLDIVSMFTRACEQTNMQDAIKWQHCYESLAKLFGYRD